MLKYSNKNSQIFSSTSVFTLKLGKLQFRWAVSSIGYSRAQLQGNVCTRPRHILHTFKTCPACVLDTSCTHSAWFLHAFWMHPASGKKGMHSRKSRCGFITRLCTYTCRHILCVFQMHLACVPDVTCTCTMHALQMHIAHVSNVCVRYLGAELYHSCHTG